MRWKRRPDVNVVVMRSDPIRPRRILPGRDAGIDYTAALDLAASTTLERSLRGARRANATAGVDPASRRSSSRTHGCRRAPVASRTSRDAYLALATKAAAVFKRHGALRVVECWGDDVPEGTLTSFTLAVQRKDNEAVVFSWIEWPSREARDAAIVDA